MDDFSLRRLRMLPHPVGVGGCIMWGGRAPMLPKRDTGGRGPPRGEWGNPKGEAPRPPAPMSPGPRGSLLSMLLGL